MRELNCKQTEKLITQFIENDMDHATKWNTERHHLQVLKSLQDGLYATQALSLLLAFLILIMVVL